MMRINLLDEVGEVIRKGKIIYFNYWRYWISALRRWMTYIIHATHDMGGEYGVINYNNTWDVDGEVREHLLLMLEILKLIVGRMRMKMN